MRFAVLPDVRAADDPHAPCIADDAVSLGNARFLAWTRAAAACLRRRGVGSGDVVAVMLPNRVEFVVALFAAWRLGAAVTPVNPALTATEARYQIADSAAKVIIRPEAGPDADGEPGTDGATDPDGESDLGADTLRIPELLRDTVGVHPAATDTVATDPAATAGDPVATALLIYTSGTTGKPKGVILSHANLSAMATMIVEASRLREDEHSLLILPLFHVNGIVVSVLSTLLAGGRVTVSGRFKADTFFRVVEAVRPTSFSAVPAIYAMLAALPESERPDTSSVRLAACGAAPMPAELIERFESRYGIPIVEGYGLSEGTCASTVNPVEGLRKPGTVGLPMPGQEVTVVDASGRPLPQGATGEVAVRGPNVMRGYLNRPEETARTIVDGRLRTGDVGRFDEDGYLVLVDRIKDMIIRGGENIYPKEIESVLHRHPGVFEAAVVGAAHPVLGEVPVAFVAPRPGASATAEELTAHCRVSLARHKVPDRVITLESLPKNPVGKIDKPTLRARLTPSPAA